MIPPSIVLRTLLCHVEGRGSRRVEVGVLTVCTPDDARNVPSPPGKGNSQASAGTYSLSSFARWWGVGDSNSRTPSVVLAGGSLH